MTESSTSKISDTMRRHPDAELTVICKWGSGTSHFAWVGGWEHSVDIASVFGTSMIVARGPLPTLCGAVIKGKWPFGRAGDLIMCREGDSGPTCRRCEREGVAALASKELADA